MAIDTSTAASPGWWLNRLMTRLGEQQGRYQLLDSYYRGEPPLPTNSAKQTFREFQRKAQLNLAALVVDSVVDRMRPVGFRTGGDPDPLGDAQAWAMWQANNLDGEAPLLFRAKKTMSVAYAIVGGPSPAAGGRPLITCEDPRQVITEPDPANRRSTIAALKVWVDDVFLVDRAKLYLPGEVWTAKRTRNVSSELTFDASGWEWEGNGERLPTFAKTVVPVVRFPNRADLAGNCIGEFEDVIPSLDRIHITILQRMVVGALQAFRQRAVKGDLPDKDLDGNAIDYDAIFEADPGAFWRLPTGVDIWESAGVDLTPLLESVKADVRYVLATTRTPLHSMFPDAVNGSAEGASLGREGLIFKTADDIVQTSDPLEQTMSLAFLFAGDTQRADRSDMEVLWQPPERVSLAERYDAATKAKAADVPWETVMRDVLGFSPQQITTMKADRLAEAFMANPTPTGTSVDVGTAG